MKKTILLYFIVIGLLAFIPFIRISVAAPPCWVGVYEDEYYIWQYNNHTAEVAGAWTTDGVALTGFGVLGEWMGFPEEMDTYALLPGNASHDIQTVGDLAPDVEYGSNYQSVQIIHAINWTTHGYTFNWDDKVTMTNVYNGLVLENSTEFVLWHNGLATFFDPYSWFLTSLWASTKLDWSEVAAAANTELAAANATVTALTDGFKITIAALDWGTNTLAIELSVTYDDGLLDDWHLTYGTDSILDVELIKGSSQFTPCAGGEDAIPGFELPIIIGVASIISLILIKKIKNK